MAKVSLYLAGVSHEITAVDAAEALAKLYNKPVTHFDPHCHHLFVLKKPYKILKDMPSATVAQHQKRLVALGFKCATETVESSSGLALVPLDAVAETKGKQCPACEQLSTDPELCSACGVIMAKFLKQKNIDTTLINKLESAENGYQRVLQMQSEEEERAKRIKLKKKQAPAPETEEESVEGPDEEVFQARYEDTGRNKILYFGIAGTVLAAVGAGYLAHAFSLVSFGDDQLEEVVTIVEAAPSAATEGDGAGANDRDSKPLSFEPNLFGQWRKRNFEIANLKQQLKGLNSAVGMTSTMHGLVANVEDPLVRAIGKQHLAKLRLGTEDGTLETSLDNKASDEYEQLLVSNPALIRDLPGNAEKVQATLSLSDTLNQLGRNKLAAVTAGQALSMAKKISLGDNPVEQVLAESMIAEFHSQRGAHEASSTHYQASVEAASMIDTDVSDQRGAVAFIVRSKASVGRFADAYGLLKKIPDENTRREVMEDISRYAESTPVEIPASGTEPGVMPESGVVSNEEMFADDEDLMLLFENDKKMKANAKKLSGLVTPKGS